MCLALDYTEAQRGITQACLSSWNLWACEGNKAPDKTIKELNASYLLNICERNVHN